MYFGAPMQIVHDSGDGVFRCWRVLMRLLWLTGLSLLAGFAEAAPFSDLWQPKDPPAFIAGAALPSYGGTSAVVTVSPQTIIRQLPPSLFGSNAAVWNGDRLLAAGTKASLQRAGLRVIRFPGGSTSDQYCWDTNYASANAAYPGNTFSEMNQSWAVSTDEFIATCRALGAEPMFTANFGLAIYGSPAEAASLAARWVKYCNVDHNYHVRYWEIGNENFGDWELGSVYPPGSLNRLTGSQYGTIFNQMAAAMKAVDPTIAIGAVGEGDNSDGWMGSMLPVVQDTADFISIHNYFVWLGGTAQSTPAALFANVSQIGQNKANVDALMTQYTHRKPGDIPYAMTEFNIENPPKHDTVELTDGLFVAMALGEFAKTGWAAANLWDVLNGWDSSGLGDHAMLSVSQPGVADGTQRASLYAYVLWSMFGDTMVTCSSNLSGIRAYAGSYTGGGGSVLLVNTDAAPYGITINGLGARSAQANLYQLTGAGYTKGQVSYNGVLGVPGGGPQDTAACPPYSATIGTTGSVTLSVPAGSVSLLVAIPPLLLGDVNMNGVVDMRDAVLASQNTAGLATLTPRQRQAAEITGDASVTPADVAGILSKAGGRA